MLHVLLSSVPDDLSPEERQELESIRRRKQELLHDIQVKSRTHTDTHFSHIYSVNQFVNFKQADFILAPLDSVFF